jgi:hypothetical protein
MILITKAEKAMQIIAIPIAFEVNIVITSTCSIIGKNLLHFLFIQIETIGYRKIKFSPRLFAMGQSSSPD